MCHNKRREMGKHWNVARQRTLEELGRMESLRRKPQPHRVGSGPDESPASDKRKNEHLGVGHRDDDNAIHISPNAQQFRRSSMDQVQLLAKQQLTPAGEMLAQLDSSSLSPSQRRNSAGRGSMVPQVAEMMSSIHENAQKRLTPPQGSRELPSNPGLQEVVDRGNDLKHALNRVKSGSLLKASDLISQVLELDADGKPVAPRKKTAVGSLRRSSESWESIPERAGAEPKGISD